MNTLQHKNTTAGHATPDSDIGAGVRAIREGLGVTVAELAKASGIRRPSIVSIERGRATTSDERDYIAAGVAWLIGNRGTSPATGRTTATVSSTDARAAEILTIFWTLDDDSQLELVDKARNLEEQLECQIMVTAAAS